MGNISKNFNIEEFIKPEDMQLSIIEDVKIRIKKNLVLKILQPLRDFLGNKITINSCYRTPAYNSKIGGKLHSFHLFNADRSAVDFTTENMILAWDWLSQHYQLFCYAYWDQQRNFIHLSGSTVTDDRVGQMWLV